MQQEVEKKLRGLFKVVVALQFVNLKPYNRADYGADCHLKPAAAPSAFPKSYQQRMASIIG